MSDIFFTYFNYMVLFAGILLCFAFFLMYKKNIAAAYNSKVLFTLVFLFFLFWIPQGFDITDEGYVLSKSWFMFHGLWHENIDMIWGSSFINGLWLSVVGYPDVFWARIGFALLLALITVVAFNILQHYFGKKESFFVVLILAVLIPFGSPQTVNYQNLPILFLLLAFNAFLKGERHYNKRYYVLFGFLIFVAAMMRFPLIVFFVFSVFYFGIDYFLNKRNLKLIFQKTVFFYSGIFIGILIISVFFYFTKSSHDYIDSVLGRFKNANVADPTHSLTYLLNVYLNDLRLILIRGFLSAGFIILISFLFGKTERKILKFLFVFLFGFLLFYYALKVKVYYNWIYTILGFEFSALLLFIVFDFKRFKKDFSLIFTAVFLFFASFVASNTGFRIHLWSGAGIFFGAVFLLLILQIKISKNRFSPDFKSIIYVFAVFLFLLSVKIKPAYIYRNQPRKKMTELFKSEELRGIKSDVRRVGVVDSLLEFTDKNISGDEIIVSGTMPMLYYLTNKKYIFKELWQQPVNEFKTYIKKENTPETFIFAKKNARNPYWPERDSKVRKTDSINYSFYKKYAKTHSYKKVYENSMFEVYSIKE